MRTVYYLQPSSFCFGVEKSISWLLAIIQKHPWEDIYCIHALVHNPKVIATFEQKGVHFVESLDDISNHHAIVVFSAHGTDRNIIQQAEKKFTSVYNLECPFVSRIYTEADQFIKKWITTFFYIGKGNHQEGKNVIAYITSQWGQVHVFQDEQSIPQISASQIAVLSQTTLNFSDVQKILQLIKKKYPQAHLPISSDVCTATYERQTVIRQHADLFETLIVIWGKESNNTKELYEIWLQCHKQTLYWESLADIVQYPENEIFAHEKIAVTGWASTPKEDIQAVIDFFVKNGYQKETLLLKK